MIIYLNLFIIKVHNFVIFRILFFPEKPVSLSSDSLAFTLVYCSVFTVTILYIGYKLSKVSNFHLLLLENCLTSACPTTRLPPDSRLTAVRLLPYSRLTPI